MELVLRLFPRRLNFKSHSLFGEELVKPSLNRQIFEWSFVWGSRRDWVELVQTSHSCTHTQTHTHTLTDTSNHEAASCCPGNAASSVLVGICGSVMGTRLPGERGGGDSELNLPAPLAQFLSQQRGGGCGDESVWVAGGSETLQTCGQLPR